MSDNRFDSTETLEILQGVVKDKGEDYVYNGPETDNGACTYASGPNGGASCIVGKVLEKMLPDYFVNVRAHEWEDAAYYIDPDTGEQALGGVNAGSVYSLSGISQYFTAGAIEMLQIAQQQQDFKNTWGQALEKAVEFYKNQEAGK